MSPSPWPFESVLDVPRNLHLKVHQIQVSNRWDIADVVRHLKSPYNLFRLHLMAPMDRGDLLTHFFSAADLYNKKLLIVEKLNNSNFSIFEKNTTRFIAPKVGFHRRLSYTKGRLPPKVVFHQRLSSTKGCLPP